MKFNIKIVLFNIVLFYKKYTTNLFLLLNITLNKKYRYLIKNKTTL